MRKIFITYRRTEAEFAAGALGRELRRHFGDEQIFRDKEDIAGGASWKQQLLHDIDKDSALLVLIGRDWAELKDSRGRRRLDNPADGVRLELNDAIKDGAAIIPVLLENAQMPDERELPPELVSLVDFNALKLRDGDWQHDVDTICRTLERVGFKPLGSPHQPAQRDETVPAPLPGKISLKAVVGATLVLLALAALGFGDLGRADYAGVAIASVVGLALGFLSWRESRNQQGLGRILGAVVGTVAVFALAVALRGYSVSRVQPHPDARKEPQEAIIPHAGRPDAPSDKTATPNRPIEEVARAGSGDLPSARSILDRHVAAIGGREALLRHSSRFASGTVSISGVSGEMAWYRAKPNKVLFKASLAGMGDVFDGFDGTRGWRASSMTGAELLTGKAFEDQQLESDFYSELTHENRYASVTTTAQAEFEGRPCYRIRLVRKTGDEEEFELYDVQTGLMAGSITKYESPIGRIAGTTVLGDYRKFGDLLQPTTVKMQGMLLQVITIATIEYDKVLPSVFDVPPQLRSPTR